MDWPLIIGCGIGLLLVIAIVFGLIYIFTPTTSVPTTSVPTTSVPTTTVPTTTVPTTSVPKTTAPTTTAPTTTAPTIAPCVGNEPYDIVCNPKWKQCYGPDSDLRAFGGYVTSAHDMDGFIKNYPGSIKQRDCDPKLYPITTVTTPPPNTSPPGCTIDDAKYICIQNWKACYDSNKTDWKPFLGPKGTKEQFYNSYKNPPFNATLHCNEANLPYNKHM